MKAKSFLWTLGLMTAIALAGCNKPQSDNTGSSSSGSSSTDLAGNPSNSSNAASPTTSGSSTSSDSGSSSGSSDKSAVTGAASDGMITTKVKSALLADKDIKGMDISVETTNGDVKLSGTAETQTQIDRSAEIARKIDGVKNVTNQLALKK